MDIISRTKMYSRLPVPPNAELAALHADQITDEYIDGLNKTVASRYLSGPGRFAQTRNGVQGFV